MNLSTLANSYQTDKGERPYKSLDAKFYTRTYEKIFSPLRDKEITLLELGIAEGGSLKLWREYFSKAHIIGMDIKEECRQHAGDRIEIVIGDCADHKVLAQHFRDIEIDIVIDDASHDTYDIIRSYQFLRLMTKKFYFIEDLHAARGVPRWLKDEDIKHTIENFLAIIPCENQS